ncbi:hypothetical protein DWU98_19725 [Dyella monticola]|uniref:Uncharacterized protein n=1 Tax=Dyella monticola TaxID=1927958 RepID=A0A370WSM0_9GAMM|nr:hypothetical protein [Dyella monticola]RDS79103.1 hypothetical protein DWU98_19725 [Dyella monticola]
MAIVRVVITVGIATGAAVDSSAIAGITTAGRTITFIGIVTAIVIATGFAVGTLVGVVAAVGGTVRAAVYTSTIGAVAGVATTIAALVGAPVTRVIVAVGASTITPGTIV